MIKTVHEISNEDGYKKYNQFEIHEDLKDIISDDYITYSVPNAEKEKYCEDLYKKNFYDKYDADAYKAVYDKYINNAKFKEKALFIYSIIDFEKYSKFVEENETIENPNDLLITYSVVDSEGVRIDMFNIGIVDISFVF